MSTMSTMSIGCLESSALTKALAALKAGLNALGMHGPCANNSCSECARAARLMTEALVALRQTNTTTQPEPPRSPEPISPPPDAKEPAYPRDPSSAEEAIEVLIAERDGLKKRAEKAEARLSSMSEYSIELQRLIEALSGGHPVPDAARAPMYRALAKCVKDERDALRKRVVELEAASMAADREIRGALVWAGIWGNPAIVVSQLKCSVSGATEAIAERDALKSEVAAVLSAGPSVRVCEGGGPENLGASLAVTVSRLRSELASAEAAASIGVQDAEKLHAAWDERDALKAKLADAREDCARVAEKFGIKTNGRKSMREQIAEAIRGQAEPGVNAPHEPRCKTWCTACLGPTQTSGRE